MHTSIDFNSLLNVPMNKWPVQFTAVSANGDGLVNSFVAKVDGRKIYGHRKNEYVRGEFTGKVTFELNLVKK